MASVFGAAGGGRFKITSPPEIKTFKIHLHKTRSEDRIFGKVKLSNDSSIQHYGLVVELQGTIILPDEKIIKIFAPDRNSPFVYKSCVYDHITGEQDAMKRAAPSADHKRTSAGGSTYPFSLKIPNDGPLPESFSFHNIKVEYKIILYQRKEFGYVAQDEIFLHGFQGYHFIHRPNPNPEDSSSNGRVAVLPEELVYNVGEYFLNDGITLQLKTVKACLTNEDILFSVTIKNPTTDISVKKVEVKLVRHMKYQRVADERDSLVVNSSTRQKNWGQDEVCLQGKLKRKSYMPSYPGEQGFRIDYYMECEVTTTSQEFSTFPGLEVIIGTAGSPGLNSGTENELSPPVGSMFRPRSGSRSSIFSFLPPAYSQLSSRAASLMSLLSFQSLPPHYNDVAEEADKEKTVEK